MNKQLHAEANHEKQVKYAAYLLNLIPNRRMGLLENMKPKLREKNGLLDDRFKSKEHC